MGDKSPIVLNEESEAPLKGNSTCQRVNIWKFEKSFNPANALFYRII